MFLFTLTFNVKFTLNIKSVVLKLYYGMTPISGTDRFLCLVNRLEGEALKEVDNFTYLGSIIDKQGGTDVDVKVRIGNATIF